MVARSFTHTWISNRVERALCLFRTGEGPCLGAFREAVFRTKLPRKRANRGRTVSLCMQTLTV
jgi:hypothetical protein